ncbi:hypothetical protein UFOVP1383_31 [uncultured Caudovirales phage]|uniref:Uncharacterized protein n=1 Tax=uncultured Caudovirales phage TaxID=2100421 RepID=A0A6J5PQF2_9CAUD|nr:hypothetical protein UFOVP848_10 [uncultured Caudovirales phage]CAB4173412.1 hypothetical protein UFOVP945_55 [uncultured Caudovirales phage]CAB4179676.1 hypothetical protein UFOVP1023_46 [uncultured Caudovirales phage]CAB4204112.1 hypothetical protein UFOVP1383_31 [uncultured Caudovirales phage]CAB4215873.1 hypothetical protein UFOVP1477_17 [uncultured Caudovirales phage]
MALLDAYATGAEYLVDTGQKISADALLTAQLTGVSRLLELALRVMPGAFNAHTGTYVFDGYGTERLRLRDEQGRSYFLRSITADSLKIDADLDGAFDDYLLDAADAWVRLGPVNAAAFSEPYRWIELRPLQSASVTLYRFPAAAGCVEITGAWGWLAVPDLVKRLVIHRTHELREGLKSGALEQLPTFEGGVPMRTQTFWLWKEAERLYGRRHIPVIV